ncbi:MAG: recombination regulator RecX [Treponema sp.]|jgi:regulatory protein|nr:recombination regulator RecX [Treponema sp.]
MELDPKCQHTENSALRLIARAEQCTKGLSLKLEKRGHPKTCIDAVIEKLCILQLLDDKRFARLWLESRLHLVRSPKRLLVSLCARGVNRDDAETALKNALDMETEYALLLRFAGKYTRKFPKHDESEAQTRSLKFFLRSEGFSSAAVQRFLEDE